MKKIGFTLAEVLITLGIIGVVAALTTPALVQNTGSAQVGPKLAKAVATFENANQNMLTNLGIERITSAGVNEIRKKSSLQIVGSGTINTYNSGFDEAAYTDALTNYMKMNYLGGRDYADYSTTSSTHKVTTYDGSNYTSQTASLAYIQAQPSLLVKLIAGFQSIITPYAYAVPKGAGDGAYMGDITPVDPKDPGTPYVPDVDRDVTDGLTPANALDLGQKYLSKDGMLYTIKITGEKSGKNIVLNNNAAPHKQMVGYVHIDINGVNGPNQLAKDVFVFSLFNDGSLQPLGGRGSGVAAEKYWDNTCNANKVTDGGLYCAGSIFENDLKVIYQ